jgi:hypothetical protein
MTNTNQQIEFAAKWCANFVNRNRETLKTVGILPMEIYASYKASTAFPIGWKSFFPILHICGCYKTRLPDMTHRYTIVEPPTYIQ